MTSTSSSAVPVFFLSDSTGISAETMGNALLIQFPDLHFERRLIPFITSVEEARRVVGVLDQAMAGPVTPLTTIPQRDQGGGPSWSGARTALAQAPVSRGNPLR